MRLRGERKEEKMALCQGWLEYLTETYRSRTFDACSLKGHIETEMF